MKVIRKNHLGVGWGGGLISSDAKKLGPNTRSRCESVNTEEVSTLIVYDLLIQIFKFISS